MAIDDGAATEAHHGTYHDGYHDVNSQVSDLYMAAARAYCEARFYYDDAARVLGEAGRAQHIEDDARATVDNSPWLRAVVDAVIAGVEQATNQIDRARAETAEARIGEALAELDGDGETGGLVMVNAEWIRRALTEDPASDE